MSTKKELVAECKRRGLKGYSNLRVAQLRELLETGEVIVEPEESEEVITLTFGEQAENHVGMEILGDGLSQEGFSVEDLEEIQDPFDDLEYETEFHRLDIPDSEPAAILIVREGVNHFVSSDDLWREQRALTWDKKAYMRGEIKNKHARWNLCYGETPQEPEYAQKKGRIISFNDVPLTHHLQRTLHEVLGEKAIDLQVEGNYYFDRRKCGIGYHGDGERKRVVAVRLGNSMPLRYQWFLRSEPVGDPQTVEINHGDLYIMSEKATGFDWKRRSILTLRHAAGCSKYIDLK